MTNAELDRVVCKALEAELPTGFVERTRARIAQQPPPPVFHGWLVPATVVALFVGIAFGITLSRGHYVDQSSVDVAPHNTRTDIVLVPVPGAQSSLVPQTMERPMAPARMSQHLPASPAAPREPEFQVLLSPIDAAAYRRIFASASSRSYEMLIDEEGVPPPETMTDIEIAPIVIAPLSLAVEDQGVFQ
jgi:hypothetical protein